MENKNNPNVFSVSGPITSRKINLSMEDHFKDCVQYSVLPDPLKIFHENEMKIVYKMIAFQNITGMNEIQLRDFLSSLLCSFSVVCDFFLMTGKLIDTQTSILVCNFGIERVSELYHANLLKDYPYSPSHDSFKEIPEQFRMLGERTIR